MRRLQLPVWATFVLFVAAAPASPKSPVPVVMGPSRDGPLHQLQNVVDRYLGPGRLDVRADFIGARAGDADPWIWTTLRGSPVVLELVARKHTSTSIGWYREDGGIPQIDGVDDGLLFGRGRLKGIQTVLRLPPDVTRFGFYVIRDPGGHSIDGDDGGVTYFSNRLLNDPGVRGAGATHPPYDGDVQMIAYDVSRWMGTGSWLVACEYSDSGGPLGRGNGESDNDYSDIVFLISGVGVTPTRTWSIGSLKALFR